MRFSALLLYLLFPFIVFSQAGMWTWMKGDSTGNGLGNYGVKGIPSPLNEPPARYAPGYWTDTAGNFWVYGGGQGSKLFSDMWKFDPVTINWTWMNGDSTDTFLFSNRAAAKGVYSPQNSPGSLKFGMFTWTTPDNHLWLFGGFAAPVNAMRVNDDLWQYNPTINQWAWMGTFGPTNYGFKGNGNSSTMPGGRYEGNAAWVDSSGNLWLFGGDNFTSLYAHNDVWKYNVATGIWTWMSGSNNTNLAGVYGTLGVPSVNNYPAARSTNLFWKDKDGNFWLSGGGQTGADLMFQDVWKFNPRSLEWTWEHGSQNPDTASAQGLVCHADSLNKEGERYENRAVWNVCDELILNYAGHSDVYSSTPGDHFLNDLWGYLPAQNKWINLASGTLAGDYGSKGVPRTSNFPPTRIGAVGFKDKSSNIWLFGGLYVNPSFNYVYYNDLWTYDIDTSCVGSLSCLNNCNLAAPVITALHDSVCANEPPVLSITGTYGSIQWQYSLSTGNFTDLVGINGPVCLDIPAQTAYYRVVVQDGNCSSVSAAYKIVVKPCVTEVPGLTNGDDLIIYPNPSSMNNVQLTISSNLIGSKLEVYDESGRLIQKYEIRSTKSEIELNVARGIYLLRISSPKVNIIRKLIRL